MDATSATNPPSTNSYAPPANNGSYDQPGPGISPWTASGVFYADVYTAIESVTNKSLTVYAGVDYGFNNLQIMSQPRN